MIYADVCTSEVSTAQPRAERAGFVHCGAACGLHGVLRGEYRREQGCAAKPFGLRTGDSAHHEPKRRENRGAEH